MADTADGLAITGPTASGKTTLAIAVAERLGGEVISMDSRQVYRGLDIGTAKPTREQQARVPHHGIDLLPPTERYNAGRFAADALAAIASIRERGGIPILVGGTGFFLRALTRPLFDEPPVDPGRKEALRQFLMKLERKELLSWLAVLDEVSAGRMLADAPSQRVARAIEVALLTGRPLSAWHREQAGSRGGPQLLTFVLDVPRDELYARINKRVDEMLAAGLVEEVRDLVAAGYDEKTPGLNATGYIELVPYVRGETTLAVAADRIRANSRAYARRQLTWFRNQLGPEALRLDATRPLPELADEIAQRFRSAQSA